MDGVATQRSGAGSRLRRSQMGFLWGIVMPVIALFIVIRVIPILVVLLMSFTNFNMIRPLVRFLPYQNFLRLFGDPNFVTAFVNSTEFVLNFFYCPGNFFLLHS